MTRDQIVRAVRAAAGAIRGHWPLTLRGALLLALSAGVLRAYGLGRLDLVLLVISLAGLLLLGLGLLATATVALVLRRRARARAQGQERRLEAGLPVETGFRLPALSWVPLATVTWDWLEPCAEVRVQVEQGEAREEVVVPRRGHHDVLRRRVTVGDVLLLWRVRFTLSERGPVTVLPNPGALRNLALVHTLAGGDNVAHPTGSPLGDRMDIRGYAPGDPVRNIMWRTYARTRELNVRMPERAVAEVKKTIAYLCRGEGDEAAAAAARVAVESGALGRSWLFGADGTPEPTSDLGAAHLAIARSGSGAHAPGLPAFLAAALRDGRGRVVVFAPPSPGPWLAAALDCVRRHPGMLSFVVATDGLSRAQAPRGWRRFLFAEEPAAGTRDQDLAAVVRALNAAGVSTLVCDRAGGRAYGAAHQQALLAALP